MARTNTKAARAAEEAKEKKAAKAAANKQRRIERAKKDGEDRVRVKDAILANPNASMSVIMDTADVCRIVYEQARSELVGAGLISPKDKEPDETAYDRLVSQGIKAVNASRGIPVNESIYEQAVAACRPLADAPWIIGDWAILVSGEAVYGEGTLQRFAADIRVEYSTLRDYAAVAKAWPKNDVRPSFSLANILRNHPDRASIGHNSKHMTCEEAREIMRKYKAGTNVVELKR